jgi:flagellin
MNGSANAAMRRLSFSKVIKTSRSMFLGSNASMLREGSVMGFRIRTNSEALTSIRHLSNNSADQNSSLEKLSSGMRINKSADDAAGLAISENLRAEIRGLNQAKRNANDGISMTQTAEGSLNEISNMLIRMRELNVQAASDTVGLEEKKFLNKEYTQLTNEIERISQSAEFNGRLLLGPTSEDDPIRIQVGTNDSPADMIGVQLGDAEDGINAETLGIAETSIATEDTAAISENLGKIDSAFKLVNNSRATIGSMQARLNSAISNLSSTTENLSSANSRIRDVDFAEETAKLSQSRILTQGGTAVLGQANQKSELALQLLR